MFKKDIRFSLILLLAIPLALLPAFALSLPEGLNHQVFLCPDAGSYLDAGRQLWLEGRLNAFRTWGYPLFTGIPYFFGAGDETARIFLVLLNVLFLTASVILLFQICKRWVGPTVALVFSILFLLSPGLVFIHFSTMTEPLFVLTILAALWFLIRYTETGRPLFLFLMSALLLYSAAVRPLNLYFSLLTAAAVCVIHYWKKHPVRYWLMTPAAAGIMILLPVIGMGAEYGTFTFTNNSRYVLYHYTASYAASLPGSTQAVMYDSFNRLELQTDMAHGWKKKGDALNWVARDSLYSAVFGGQLKHRSKSVAVALWNNLKENATAESQFIPKDGNRMAASVLLKWSGWQNIIFSIGVPFLAMLALFFSGRVLRNKTHVKEFLILVFVLAQMAVMPGLGALSFWQGDRFSLGIYPLVFIGSSILVFIYKGIYRFKERVA